MLLSNLVISWKDFLQNEKAFSSHTVNAYETDLRYFILFLNSYLGKEIDLNDLENLKIVDFRAWLSQRKRNELAFSSSSRAIAALKNFFKYLIRFHHFSNKTIFNLRNPKVSPSIPKALNENQTFMVLKTSEENSSELWIGIRDKALLYLLYGSGLRISEALSLRIKDISKDFIIIKGKGNKERIVPLINEVKDLIIKYLELCPYKFKQESFIFIGKQGKTLNPGVFQRNLRNLRRKYNLPENMTPHTFRHCFATHILANGGDLKSIQDLLGHESLVTTQKYTKVDAQHLLDIYKKSHPYAK